MPTATPKAEALRAARKARLASTQPGTAPAAQSDSSLKTQQANQPKPAAKQAAPTTAAPAAGSSEPPRELIAKVTDLSKIEAGALITMAGPYGQGTENPHWVVLADGEPLAKIALADQDKPDEIRRVFPTTAYAQGVTEAINKKQIELPKLLTSLKARPYVAAVKGSDVYSTLDRQYKAEAAQVFQKKAATYRDDLHSLMLLVAEAQRKNYLTENPLKAALFSQMRRAGVADPTPIIEASFVDAWPAHFESMFKQASKWMDFNADAMADIKQSITDMPAREIQASRVPAQVPNRPVPSSAANVPVVPVGKEVQASPDEKAAAKGVFSFRKRMHEHKLAPKS